MITYLYSLDMWWRQEGRSATWQCHNVIKNGEQHDQQDQLCSWQKPFVWSSRIPCSSMSSDLQTGSDLNISWSTVVDRPIHCKSIVYYPCLTILLMPVCSFPHSAFFPPRKEIPLAWRLRKRRGLLSNSFHHFDYICLHPPSHSWAHLPYKATFAPHVLLCFRYDA